MALSSLYRAVRSVVLAIVALLAAVLVPALLFWPLIDVDRVERVLGILRAWCCEIVRIPADSGSDGGDPVGPPR